MHHTVASSPEPPADLPLTERELALGVDPAHRTRAVVGSDRDQ